jgi:ABC-2 type transport system ATP-binding protein
MTMALQVNELRRSFGDLVAVDDVSFEIEPGETFGLLGPNGAGKTTVISMICGLLEPDSGSVHVNGIPITVRATRGRELIGYVPQELAIYTDMSGRDNLKFFAGLYGIRGADATRRIDEALDVVSLSERAGDKVSEYSGGMQRRLNIAAGMLHEPSLLILDEPTVGIDPQSRNQILEAIGQLGTSGMSVLYTTHYMEEAERLCRRLAIIDRGKVLAMGTQRELVDLVGEHDHVKIAVGGSAADASNKLEQVPGVLSAGPDDANEQVACVVDRASEQLPAMLSCLRDANIAIQGVQVQEPSLDAVFLHVTGTALRD